jgi:hypothetical protein
VPDILRQLGFAAMLCLAMSFVPLVVAVAYVVTPTERTLAVARATSLATIFGAVSGLLIGAAMVLKGLAVSPGPNVDMSNVYLGLAETLTPSFISFGMLAASWLLIATGILRRS